MNTTAAKPASTETAAERQAKYEKHQKKSRYFPSVDQIQKKDRFSISKGSSVFCSAVNSTIILSDDIKVEILDIDDSTPNQRSFIANRLTPLGNGDWSIDQKFGNLDVQYTDLAAWHYQSKA